MGQILVARNASSEELAEWQQAVPLNCANYPPLWYALALSHLHRSDSPSAIRCLWETLRLNPEHLRSTYQLGQSLVGLGMERQAEAFLNLSRSLEAYVSACEVAHHLNEPSHLLSAAKLAEELGLPREAWGWAKLALQRSAQSPDALAIVTRSEARLAELDSVRMLPDHNPALTVDLSDLVPQTASSPSATGQRVQQARLNATVSFQDDAANAGLNFVYFNAGQPEQGLVYMYEVVGGGVGVLDYDRDGWPDMVFPQGAPWPLQPDQQASLDRLFRNRGDGRFVDVTSQACLFENGFSQGVSVGDFDDDGFPDLYVLNIQGNRLFQKSGCGTFTDVTARAGIAGDRYSVSGLIADLNGDSLPDIYTVNYLSGEELFTKVCADGQGRRGSCLPHLFLPSADRCFLNLGDGRFEDVTESSGIGQVSGMGLGIVAFRSQGDDGLNLFIANDIGPNFLFVNETGTDDRPLFVERGTVAGLAYNQLGQQEASMGIAAGDVDGDGRLDLFVTNFDDETNTLYRQRSGTLFEDATSEARLSRKTQPYVGWGTQFIDAELDGWPDLILTNGHVNDLRHLGKPFLMRSQFYRNLGAGRFVELTGDRLGEFFQQQRLGRGLARLDWNRDGREDVVISHLGSPAALLTNTTQGAGHALRIRLTATQSSRDAIGAIVTAQVGDQQLTMQLTAGDGNQSSNERQLVFGLNDATVADVVTVQWPSQAVQIFGPLSAGPVWLLVEGTEQAFDLP